MEDSNTNIISFPPGYQAIISDMRDALQTMATNSTQIAADVEAIKNSVASSAGSLSSMQSSIATLENRGNDTSSGIVTRPIVVGFGGLNEDQQRAILISSLKASGRLDELEAEINDPTDLPGD